MVLHDLSHVFNTLDVDCKGFIEWDAVQEFDGAIYFDALDIDQIEAAIDMVICFVLCLFKTFSGLQREGRKA